VAKNFWHNKRVLVTGGAGFLGTYVVRSFDCAQERERGRVVG
jgi:nucleoside-diphosphate-sugar epimerase